MRHLILVGLVTLAAPRAAFAEEPVKIGYVDLQRALNETEDGRKAKDNLKKVFEQKQKEIKEREDAVRKEIDDFNKKKTLLPPEVVSKKEEEIRGKMEQVQQIYLRHQQTLQTQEQEATAKIFDRMTRIINKIAVAENFSIVLDKNQSAILFAKPHLDVTNELIRRYNSGEEAGGGGAAPAKDAGKGKK